MGDCESAADDKAEIGDSGSRLREREANGDRPPMPVCRRTLRSMGERGEAGEASSERPTVPMGEHGMRRPRPPLLPPTGETPPDDEADGGRMAALR